MQPDPEWTSSLTNDCDRISDFCHISPLTPTSDPRSVTDCQNWHHRNLMHQDSGSFITDTKRKGGCSVLTDGIYMIILTTCRHPWAFILDSIRSKWILVTICKEGSVSLKTYIYILYKRVRGWLIQKVESSDLYAQTCITVEQIIIYVLFLG